MLKAILFFLLTFNLAFAARFEEADRKKFIEEVKVEIAQHKLENGGKVNLQIIKPEFYKGLDELFEQEKFTRDEVVVLKQRFENFSKDKSITPQNAEAAFFKFLEFQLNEINQRPLEKLKEGQICNNWGCEKDLKCAPDPVQDYGKQCQKSGLECKGDTDCCSGECIEDSKTKRRVCEDVYRCFKPLAENQACNNNPVCAVGSCLPVNALTGGVDECRENARSCDSNADCCSGFCNGRVCRDFSACKDCVPRGSRADRGKKCCEGLIPSENGVCIPDLPPFIIPQVKVSPVKKLFISLVDFMMGSAQAADPQVADDSGTAPKDEPAVAEDGDMAPKKSDEEIAKEEDGFLKTRSTPVDSSDIVSTIKGNENKYGAGFQAKSDTFTPDVKKTAALKLSRKSNFETCDMKFKDDFMSYLEANKLLELEMALLGFDFVMSGDGVNDYWTSQDGSIYKRLKEASTVSREQRKELHATIEKTNKELTCICLDVKGIDGIKDEAKKEFFKKECPEYAKYTNPDTPKDQLAGDASGVKGKKLIVAWTNKLAGFNKTIAVDHTKVKEKVDKVLEWMGDDQKFSETEQKTHTLFNFNIKNPSGSSAALGALLGSILAAGVIAILGGFGTASILTAWGAAGIIAASAVTGAGGLWMISSLRGAWIAKRPEIADKYVRSYGCGKKETCVEYSRQLIQPYNNICKINASANACVKDFLVIREKGKKNDSDAVVEESTFLVDPWVPAGVPKELIIKDSINGPTYAEKLDAGFNLAKAAMLAKNPMAVGGGGKKGGGEFVPESYLSEVFLDPELVGKYVPQLGQNLEEKYFLKNATIQQIKKAAIEFALAEKFFEKDDKENLEIFAEYAYQYHFVYPKRSRSNEIGYPTVGLRTYVDLIANKVVGTLAANAVNAVGNQNTGFTNLNTQYLQDYLNTLNTYDKASTSDGPTKQVLKAEIDAAENELENMKFVSGVIANPSMDSVGAMNKAIGDFKGGASGRASLSAGDKAYMQAVGKLRTDRKNQLKKYEHYKKAVAARGNKDRDSRVARAAASFSKRFTSPSSSGSGSGASGLGSSLADTVGAAEANANSGENAAGAGAGYGASFASGAGAADASGVGSGIYGAGSFGSSSRKELSNGAGASRGTGYNGMSDEDRKRLSDAIDARNRAKGKYDSSDGQTLFEKVTNAYIRNYDKVLSKKKDKDLVEPVK